MSAGLPQTAPSLAGSAAAWGSCGSQAQTCSILQHLLTLWSCGANPSQGAELASLRGNLSAIPELGTPMLQSLPAGKFSPFSETFHQEPVTKGHFSLQIWRCAPLGIKSCILLHHRLNFITKRQTKKPQIHSELMTHPLWIAESCHFPQSSLDTQSKRTWEELYPTSPQGKQEVVAEVVKSWPHVRKC